MFDALSLNTRWTFSLLILQSESISLNFSAMYIPVCPRPSHATQLTFFQIFLQPSVLLNLTMIAGAPCITSKTICCHTRGVQFFRKLCFDSIINSVSEKYFRLGTAYRGSIALTKQVNPISSTMEIGWESSANFL